MFDYFYGQSGEMFSYFRVPKILFRDIKFKDLSTDAKTLYGILLDRMGLSVKNGWLDEQGRVYIIFPVQEVMDALGCADNKATKLFRELEKFGLIERKRRGLGKPNLIYVKNFADPRFRNREKNGSGAADSAQQEAAKSRGNKTEWNKTEGSEPDPFPSDAEDEPDERTRLEAYFMQSLEVDLLLRVCPDEEDTIDQIVNLLVDTCSSKRRMLRVAGDDKPAEVVRSRFMKLNALAKKGYLIKTMKQKVMDLPNTYMQYYLLGDEVVKSSDPNHTRANEVMEGREKRIFDAVADYRAGKDVDLTKFFGGVHGEFIVDVAMSLAFDLRKRYLVMVENNGAVENLPSDAMVEIPAYITDRGPEPVRVGEIPTFYKGLIEQQEAVEKLIVDAAVEHSYEKALMAFTLSKTVPSLLVAKKILDDMIVANKAYWPELH